MALCLALGGLVLLGASGILLLTLGYDEAWILTGIQGILGSGHNELPVPSVLTTGGIYAGAQLLITSAFGNLLWLQRSFCFACAIASILIVARWSARAYNSRLAGLIAVSGLCATPGFFLLGATAYGALPALFLSLVSFEVFVNWRGSRWGRWIVVGLLAGLAAATRPNCCLVLPAILVVTAFLPKGQRLREALDALISGLVAVAVFLICLLLYYHFGQQDSGTTTDSAVESVFQIALINYPFYLNKWVISQRFAPLPFLFILTGLAVWLHSTIPSEQANSNRLYHPWIALLPFGWLGFGAWLVASPIPHLRYIFPALAGFWIVLGITTASLYHWGSKQSQPVARLAALLISLSCVIYGAGETTRNLIHGNGNILSWEWAGQSRTTYFTRFRHQRYQREAAEHLWPTTADGEPILSLGLNRELGYLANRTVLEGRALAKAGLWDPQTLPSRLFLSPHLGNFIYMSPSCRQWIEANCELEAQFGPYSFYRVIGEYPVDFSLLQAGGETYPGHPLSGKYP